MSRSRHYVFTINNPTDDDENSVFGFQFQDHARYIVAGKEVGEECGTPHLQCYLSFTEKKSMRQVSELFPRARLAARRGTHEEAANYCKKDGDFYEWGVPPVDDCGAAGRESMEQLMAKTMKCIRDKDYESIPFAATHFIKACEYRVFKEDECKRDISTIQGDLHEVNEWRYGKTGTGKSRPIREAAERGEISLYLKNCNKWWCNYRGEDVVMIEDFDKRHDVLAHYLKIWVDRYSFCPEVKNGRMDNIRPRKIVVTSNYHPMDIWSDPSDYEPIMRRFKIVHVLGTVGTDIVNS